MKTYNGYEFGKVIGKENEYEIVKWDSHFEDCNTIITFVLDSKGKWKINYIDIKFFDNYESGLISFVKECLSVLRLGDKYTTWKVDEKGEYRCSQCGTKAPYDIGSGSQICPRFCYNCGKEVKIN